MKTILLGLMYFSCSVWAAAISNEELSFLGNVFRKKCDFSPYRSVFQMTSNASDHSITCFVRANDCADKLVSSNWPWQRDREINSRESRLLSTRGIDDYSDNICVFELKFQTKPAAEHCKYGWMLSKREVGPWQCYKAQLTWPKTYDQARAMCTEKGASLPQVVSKEDYDALIEFWRSVTPARNINGRTIFIGLAEKSNSRNSHFVWDFDGTSLNSRDNQFPEFVNSSDRTKRCAMLSGNYNKNRINQWQCDCVNKDCPDNTRFKIRAVVCQMPAEFEPQYFCSKGHKISKIGKDVFCTKGNKNGTVFTAPQYFCEDNWFVSPRPNGGPVCIKTQRSTSSYKTISYDDANAVCKSQGAYLPQLITQGDLTVLMQSWSAVLNPHKYSVYIGMNNYGPETPETPGLASFLDDTGVRGRSENLIWDVDGTGLFDRYPIAPDISRNHAWKETMPTFERCVIALTNLIYLQDWNCDCVKYDCKAYLDNWFVQEISCMKPASTIST